MYVLISECRGIVKFGYSRNLNSRIRALIAQENKVFYLLYESHKIKREKATEIERKLTEEFNDYLIKGNEWLKINPIKVIEFIISEIGLNKGKELVKEVRAKFDWWLSPSSNYRQSRKVEPYGIRMDKQGICYIKFINNLQFIVIAFCNLGDAEKFYQSNRYNIEASPKIIELLHGVTYSEWSAKNFRLITSWL